MISMTTSETTSNATTSSKIEDSGTRDMTVAIAVGVSVGVVAFAVFMLFGLVNGFRYLHNEIKSKACILLCHVYLFYKIIINFQNMKRNFEDSRAPLIRFLKSRIH